MLSNRRVVAYTVVLVLVSYLMNYFMREEMYKEGVNMIYRMQQDVTPFKRNLFNWISLLVDPFLITAVMLGIFLQVDNKFRVVVLLVFFLLNTYFVGTVKALYAESRPYWTNAEIQSLQWYCPLDFGNPSGHSWLSGVFYYLLILEYLGAGPYHAFLLVPLATSLVVPLSRMYLGAHSANQVLQGVVNGAAMLVVYRYWLHDWIRNWVNSFLHFQDLRQKTVLRRTVLANVVVIILPMLCCAFNAAYELPAQQVANIVAKCGTPDGKILQIDEKLMQTSCAINFAFGLVYGLALLGADFRYYFGLWEYTPGNRLARRLQKLVLGELVFFVPLVALFLLGRATGNPYVVYTLLCVGLLASGFLFTGYSCRLLRKYNVIQLVESQK